MLFVVLFFLLSLPETHPVAYFHASISHCSEANQASSVSAHFSTASSVSRISSSVMPASSQLWQKGSPCFSWPAARQANHFRVCGPEYTVVPAPTRTLPPSLSKPAVRNSAGILVPVGSGSGSPLNNARLRFPTHSRSRPKLCG